MPAGNGKYVRVIGETIDYPLGTTFNKREWLTFISQFRWRSRVDPLGSKCPLLSMPVSVKGALFGGMWRSLITLHRAISAELRQGDPTYIQSITFVHDEKYALKMSRKESHLSPWAWLDGDLSCLYTDPPASLTPVTAHLSRKASACHPEQGQLCSKTGPEKRRSYGIPANESRYASSDSDTLSQPPSECSALSRVHTETYIDHLVSDRHNSPASTRLLQIIQEEGVAPASPLGLSLLTLVKQLQSGGQYNPIVIGDSDGEAMTEGSDRGVKAALEPINDRLNDFAAMLNTIAEVVGVELLESDEESDPIAPNPTDSQGPQPRAQPSRQLAESSPPSFGVPLGTDPPQTIIISLQWDSDKWEWAATTTPVATEGSGSPATLFSDAAHEEQAPTAERFNYAQGTASTVKSKREETTTSGRGVKAEENVNAPCGSADMRPAPKDEPRPATELDMFVNHDLFDHDLFDSPKDSTTAPPDAQHPVMAAPPRATEMNMFVNHDLFESSKDSMTAPPEAQHPNTAAFESPPSSATRSIDEPPTTPAQPKDSPKSTRERLQEILEEAEKLALDPVGGGPDRRASTRCSVHWPEEALTSTPPMLNQPSTPARRSSFASRTINDQALVPRSGDSASSDDHDPFPSTASTIHISPFSEPAPHDYRPSWWRAHDLPRPAPFDPQSMSMFGPGAPAGGFAPIFDNPHVMGPPPWASVDPRHPMYAQTQAYPGVHNRWIPPWRWTVPHGHPYAYVPGAQGGWRGPPGGF